MHHAAFPPACFLSIVIASIAQDSTGQSDINLDDFYDYNYTLDYNELDAYTPRPPGNFSEQIDIEEDFCHIPGLTTGQGLLPVGCTTTCFSGNQTYLKDGTLCVQCTVQGATKMEAYTNLTCPLGECCRGVCESCNRTTWCWKHNIMLMPAPN
uniref:Evasin n=1 Tax=Amblyomma cajennense TaxID=34607 RepID=A0A023FQ71_AMBCJ